MDRLPLEISQLICAFARDDCQESLYSLSLLNHDWYTAAVPSLFETLTIKFTDHTDLERIVMGIKENKLRRQYLTHARCLDLICLPDIERQYVDKDSGIDTLVLSGSKDKRVTLADFLPDTARSFLGSHLTDWHHPGLSHSPTHPGFYKEKQWEPLIMLISSLERLTEFNYVLANMFPKCILQAVHKCHPKCRLNIWGWQFLNQHKPGLEGLRIEYDDPFEMDILSSPCLHAISLLYSANYHLTTPREVKCQNVFPIITMAPNLKHVHLRCHPWDILQISDNNNNWKRYMASLDPSYPATPASLCFHNYGMEEEVLPMWMDVTDFSSLQSLSINKIRHPTKLKDILLGLQNLKWLFIDVTPLPYSSPNFENELGLMFNELNPLRYLRIRGTGSISVFQGLLTRHGTTLQGLIIEPIDRPESSDNRRENHAIYPLLGPLHVTQFAELCPYLEELRLPIARSLGNQREYQLYEALGKFRSLRSLVLDLDCNSPCSWDTSSTANASSHSKIHSVFANAAMDETLARSIWDLVSSNQQTRRLRHLRISIFGGNPLHWAERYVILHLSRSFLITRTWPLELEIIEIGREERELLPQRVAEYRWERVPKLPKRLQRIIQSLWPSADKGDWMSSWRSLPLCADNLQSHQGVL